MSHGARSTRRAQHAPRSQSKLHFGGRTNEGRELFATCGPLPACSSTKVHDTPFRLDRSTSGRLRSPARAHLVERRHDARVAAPLEHAQRQLEGRRRRRGAPAGAAEHQHRVIQHGVLIPHRRRGVARRGKGRIFLFFCPKAQSTAQSRVLAQFVLHVRARSSSILPAGCAVAHAGRPCEEDEGERGPLAALCAALRMAAGGSAQDAVELLSSSSSSEGEGAARGVQSEEVAALAAQLAAAEAAAAAARARVRAAQRDEEAAEARAAELRTALARAEAAAALEAPDYSAEDGFAWSAAVLEALQSAFGLGSFRGWQRAAINATLDRRDVFLVAPSGGGKSLCYQLPAIVGEAAEMQSVTLVVCPLVSLMQDQVAQLAAKGIRAFAMSAATPREEQARCYRAMAGEGGKTAQGEAEQRDSRPLLVYVTPERLQKSKRIIGALQKAHSQGRLARVAVDEAHCLSAFGHDYRPDYLKLSKLRELYPGTPIIAATATATPRVVKDSVNRLRMHGAMLIRESIKYV